MKNEITIAIIMTLAHSLFAEPYQKPTPEQRDAMYNGANTRIVFKVLDYDGGIVSNALVRTSFDMWPRENNNVQGLTDENGIYVAEGKSTSKYSYDVNLNGYYESDGSIFITPTRLMPKKEWDGKRRSAPYVTNGSWIINNPTNIVILKKIKDPVKMELFHVDKELKIVESAMGFDLEKGDFIMPYGKGEVVDFVLDFEGWKQSMTNYYYKLTMSFTNGVDGAYIQTQDDYSDMTSAYTADLNTIYTNKLVYEEIGAEKKSDRINTSLSEDSYLILRTRSKLNSDGSVNTANYSKVYGPIVFDHEYIRFTSYFNSATNSVNLEHWIKWMEY